LIKHNEHEASNAVDSTTPPATRFGWLQVSPLDLLKVVAGVAVLVGVLMHVMGAAGGDAYLREFGVEASLFPKSVDRIQMGGFLWLLVSGLTLWPAVLENALELLLLTAIAAAYWTLLRETWKSNVLSEPPRWFARLRPWLQRLSATFVMALLAIGLLVVSTFFASFILAQPLVLAERLGREHAQKDRAHFVRGCRPDAQPRCMELRRGADVVGRGFVIESSPEFIAFYDVGASSVRVIPRKDLEVIIPSR
jgi:hypothetical protein